MIPAPSPLPFGIAEALDAAGLLRGIEPEGWNVTDEAAALAIIAAYDPAPAAMAAWRAAATEAKWRAIEGGIVVGDIPVNTDSTSQGLLQGLLLMAMVSPGPFPFKDRNGGFRLLTAEQAKALVMAVGAHVQACYAREAEAHALIYEEITGLDPTNGFPINGQLTAVSRRCTKEAV
jgi:hypothetical protein